MTLEDAGFRAVEASTVEDGFQRTVIHRPFVVLAACTPDLDGAELASRMGQHPATRQIPVVLMVDPTPCDLSRVTGGAWIHAVVRRPCARDVLLEHVRQAVTYAREVRSGLSGTPGGHEATPDAAGSAPVEAVRAMEMPDPVNLASAGRSRAPECPECGSADVELVGETRHSTLRRCRSCRSVSVEPR
jgi:CheY-like chemotaxis protein